MEVKVCSQCGKEKALAEYHKEKNRKDIYKYRANCKVCKNKQHSQWTKDNAERVNMYNKEQYYKYPNRYKKSMATWKRNNRGKVNKIESRRRAAKINRTPDWLTEDDHSWMAWIYSHAQKMKEIHGIVFHVDHIYPLQGKTSCGLHVPWNLQILTFEENVIKSNKIYDLTQLSHCVKIREGEE